jgi:lysyl-tRNA synthetase class I
MRALPLKVSFISMIVLGLSGTQVPRIGLWNARESSEQFYTDATRHSDLDLTLASFFPTGGEFIMSMHQYMPDQAVLADSWTLFCPECAQKMRLIMATPALDGKATRTYECAYGHRERITAALP